MEDYPRNFLPTSPGWPLRVLRLGLLISAVGWGISFFFTFSSWESAAADLEKMGAGPLPSDPMLDYWLKMTSAAFGCIGIASALACFRPTSFQGLICLLGPFHLFIGIVLTVSAFSNDLNPARHPTFIADITFCFLTALLILAPLAVTFRKRKP